ncbi:hypothetical protein M0R45_020616 [Rubus argutus]|uniref:Uncharacterized protein n=1 Tax=Rubus argutus TaxID=59490 RepID=A0AAW1XC40_RUBAR
MGTLTGASAKAWSWIKISLLLCLDLALRDTVALFLRMDGIVIDGKLKVLNVEEAPSDFKVSGGDVLWDRCRDALVFI